MLATVSIIMPVYNAGEFLPKSMNSLVSQTFSTIEILCINDGSDDNSLQILQEFAERDSRIKVFDQVNSGPARARTVGLENAVGDYIMFCDADDWYEPTMVEEMYNAITQNNVAFAMCDTNIIEEISGFERGDDLEYYKIPFVGLKSLEEVSEKLKINVTLWNKIFQADIIRKYTISFPDGCLHDDDAFIIQYVTVSREVYFLNKKLYNYLIRAKDSIMAEYFSCKKTQRTDCIQLIHFYYDWLVLNCMYDTNKKLFSLFYARYVMLDFYRLEESCLEDAIKKEKAFLSKIQVVNVKQIKRIKKASVQNIVRRIVNPHEKSTWKIMKYCILSKITFGTMRKKYQNKYRESTKRGACSASDNIV